MDINKCWTAPNQIQISSLIWGKKRNGGSRRGRMGMEGNGIWGPARWEDLSAVCLLWRESFTLNTSIKPQCYHFIGICHTCFFCFCNILVYLLLPLLWLNHKAYRHYYVAVLTAYCWFMYCISITNVWCISCNIGFSEVYWNFHKKNVESVSEIVRSTQCKFLGRAEGRKSQNPVEKLRIKLKTFEKAQ